MTSPSVKVTVNDQSVYSEVPPTTVPILAIATRSNKSSPDGNGIAPGTTEANVLRQVTSQRELNQLYGNAVFVTSAGQPVHGDETNEYGLHALHSFLGLGNTAFVIRADVDLGQLIPNTVEPTLPAPDGTYWLNQSAAVGGIFTYNGSTWEPVSFSVYVGPTPDGSIGDNGDWIFDYSSLNGTIKFKDGGTWYAASTDSVSTVLGATFSVQLTAPIGPSNGDIWWKTSSSAGGVNLMLARYRAADGVFVSQVVVRSTTPPVPNEGVIWEDISSVLTNGNRPLYVGTGATFIPLEVYVQDTQPVTEPDTGTIWYDDTITDFALYMEGSDVSFGNQWVPIETTTVSNPTITQKVISASAPQFPAVGAIWVDLSTPDAVDNFPLIRKWSGTQWVDITDTVVFSDSDPVASVVLNGTYWVNLGESKTRNTVKRYNPNYTPVTVEYDSSTSKYNVVAQMGNHWEPATGKVFGRKSQRAIVVQKLQEAIVGNDAMRSEVTYFQLIACPGYPELYDEMLALNADNGETAFIVADTPKFMRPSGIPTGREVTAAEWKTNAHNVETTGERGFASAPSPYAGFYYPWGLGTDPVGNNVMVPPSHMALRTIAYSDSVAAPWFPPAGPSRGRVDNVGSVGFLNNNDEYSPVTLTKAQRDILYENEINPIAFITQFNGLMVFGQKTNSGITSAMDRINVARLIAKMKYDLQRLLENFLFEINDATTRRSAQVVTERYLAGLKSMRAVYDFAVRCNNDNNTPDRIDRNELWVDVSIKPAKSIEFIYVPISIVGTGDDFDF